MKLKAKVQHKGHRNEFLAKVKAFASRQVVVGIPAAKSKRSAGAPDNAELGVYFEFGTEHMPARPWLQPPMAIHHDEHVAALAALYRSAKTEADIETGLARLGMVAAGQVKAYITQGSSIPPELAAETVRRKGSTRALVDTGAFVASIDAEVRPARRAR